MNLLRYALFLLVTAICPLTLSAQTALLSQLGVPPGIPTMPIPNGAINLGNLSFHIEIPISTRKQRNGTTFTIKLVYDSYFYYLDVQTTQVPGGSPYTSYSWYTVSTPPPIPNINPGVGWRLIVSPSATNANIAFNYQVGSCGGGTVSPTAPSYTWSGWQYIDNDGTAHLFDGISTQSFSNATPACAAGDQPTASGYANDGSGYYISIVNYNNATIYDVNGNTVFATYTDPNNYTNDSILWVDPNGNEVRNMSYTPTGALTPTPITDELGRPVSLPAGFSIQNGSVNIGTTFCNCSGVQEATGSIPTLASISLPDGRQYSFTYDGGGSGHTGVMTSMSMPTGGTVRFVSKMLPAGGLEYGPIPLQSVQTQDGTWTISSFGSSGYGIVVTAPTDTVTNLAAQTTYQETCSGVPYSCTWVANSYNGSASGTPLKSTTTVVDNEQRVTSMTTAMDNQILHSETYTYISSTSSLVSSKKEYGPSSNLLRETDVAYVQTAAYVSKHILSLPQTVTVYGSGGSSSTPVAQTTYAYDGGTPSTLSGFQAVSVIGATNHDDADYGLSNTFRGNLTSISKLVSPGVLVQQSASAYNILGDVISNTDGNNNKTLFDYSDSWTQSASCVTGTTFAYQTASQNPLSQKTASSYNDCDGSVHSVRDQNDINASRTGTTYLYDTQQRLIEIDTPDGGSKTTNYGSDVIPQVITLSKLADPDPKQSTTQTLDGLGRVVATVDGSGAETDTTYDALGRIGSVTNPYYAGTTANGTTSYTYDGLGRKTIQTQQDGSTQQWSYAGNETTFTDELGHSWQRTNDALGRLMTVVEPGNLNTSYTYNALDNLTNVTQSGSSSDTPRTRSFTYDSLSRLLCASNPENSPNLCPASATATMPSGVTSYGYDANGNLTSKTDARSITTNYTYDALNRLLSKTYTSDTTGTASSCYQYDGASTTNSVGRLTNQWTQKASLGACAVTLPSTGYLSLRSVLVYDSMGRVQSEKQCTKSNCVTGTPYNPKYTYDLAGNILTHSNGMNTLTFTNSYDASGSLLSIVKTTPSPSTTLFSAPVYSPAGGLTAALFGTGLQLSRSYDSRLRVTGETDIGNTAATPGSAILTITGNEHMQP